MKINGGKVNENKEGRELQVVVQMSLLKDRLAELEKSTHNLKDRLASVLRSDALDGGKEPDMAKPNFVPLAEDINSSANRVASINAKIINLLKELEL